MKSLRHDEGFTGLEAAIVLIAFVVVAAVFSYVVLGAGFFTTQKSQEVVHTGVAQASSTLEIVGNVYGSGDTGAMSSVNFSIALAPGGTAVDFEKVVLTYSNTTQLQTMGRNTTAGGSIGDGMWGIVAIRNDAGGSNWLLEKGEQFDIGARPSMLIYKNDAFNIEVKPATGSPLDIKRTAPAALQTINILY
jgi:flagellin FlaB